jgi:hypothetical protein
MSAAADLHRATITQPTTAIRAQSSKAVGLDSAKPCLFRETLTTLAQGPVSAAYRLLTAQSRDGKSFPIAEIRIATPTTPADRNAASVEKS